MTSRLYFSQLLLEAQQAFLVSGLHQLVNQAAAVVKPTESPFWQAARPRPRAIWGPESVDGRPLGQAVDTRQITWG